MVEQQKQEPEIPELSRTQVLIAMGITAIILWTVAKLWLGFGDVILFRLYWQPTHLVWGLGLGLSITIFSGLVYRLSSEYRKSADYYLRMVLKPLVLPDLIWLGLLPGLSEELLFRGVMLPALGADHLAVIISSLCFGVLHLTGAKQWPYAVWATIIGIVLSYGALWSGNLLVPIVAHTSTNCLGSYLWKRWQPKAT
ncbi:CPBP family intramembrane metalloprotease [Cylindrospermopsis raciborskii LB2897]|uniref:CPBP family intramembrane glutamic endopeptidase n=1 Tax=Cylindrospermopsis raciborskii TaxID=77022 RepID=UPI001454E0F5|nr:CPBP family intramembrane glutamic endopeptidase [Cylindrospermopsis raciborskii]MBG0742128.1 CPBP family intramembrane metalloprotease [Cylindrospermopsis raciborskii KL1]NLQ07379.1 CPBP family intramembrane metalloprotease [Cylindrospermopsis raciborskii LB2897]